MITSIQIEQMSREEKIRTMEAIWAALSEADDEVESPTWHEDVLKETEARVAAGLEPVTDWEKAKRELRKKFE